MSVVRRTPVLLAAISAIFLAELVPAFASIAPARWVVSRAIGVTDDGWVALVTGRNIATRYAYGSTEKLVVFDSATGCPRDEVVLYDSKFEDADASGDWAETAIGTDAAKLELFTTMRPLVPSPWVEEIALINGAFHLMLSERSVEVLPIASVLEWANVQTAIPEGSLRIAAVYESVDAWRDDDVIFVEVETEHRDVDVDYARFVVPLDASGARNLLTKNVIDKSALGASQPQRCEN